MTRLRKLLPLISLAAVAVAVGLHAQTNLVMSPVAGYQFYDSLSDMGTNSPVVTAVTGYQYYDALNESGTNSPIVSAIAAYQFFDSLGDTGTNSPIISTVAAYQFFDALNDMETNSVVITPVPAYYYGPDGIHLQLAVLPDGTPQLSILAAAGQNYTIQFSTNLIEWVPFSNVTFGYPALFSEFNLPITTNSSSGFYRVVTQ